MEDVDKRIVVMGEEPAQAVTIEEMKRIAEEAESETELAVWFVR